MSWGMDGPTEAPDVQNAVIDLLVDALALDGATVSVGAAYPDDATPERPSLPFLGVMDLGSPEWHASHEVTLIQITAWADNPGPAKKLAALARGHLIAFQGSDVMGAIEPATRQGVVLDPDTGYYMAPFTVRVLSRAI